MKRRGIRPGSEADRHQKAARESDKVSSVPMLRLGLFWALLARWMCACVCGMVASPPLSRPLPAAVCLHLLHLPEIQVVHAPPFQSIPWTSQISDRYRKVQGSETGARHGCVLVLFASVNSHRVPHLRNSKERNMAMFPSATRCPGARSTAGRGSKGSSYLHLPTDLQYKSVCDSVSPNQVLCGRGESSYASDHWLVHHPSPVRSSPPPEQEAVTSPPPASVGLAAPFHDDETLRSPR